MVSAALVSVYITETKENKYRLDLEKVYTTSWKHLSNRRHSRNSCYEKLLDSVPNILRLEFFKPHINCRNTQITQFIETIVKS